MSKLRLLVLAAIIGAVSGLGAVAAAQTFTDVPPSHPFFDEIEWMASTGISEGYADGTYRPSDPVTRMAMSAFMQRAAELHQVFGAVEEGIGTVGGAPVLLVDKTFTVPADGYLAVLGGYRVGYNTGGDGFLYANMYLDGAPINTTSILSDTALPRETTVAVTIPVTVGEHTIEVEAYDSGFGSNVYRAALQVVYSVAGDVG